MTRHEMTLAHERTGHGGRETLWQCVVCPHRQAVTTGPGRSVTVVVLEGGDRTAGHTGAARLAVEIALHGMPADPIGGWPGVLDFGAIVDELREGL